MKLSQPMHTIYCLNPNNLPYSTCLRATHRQVASFTLNKAKDLL